MQTTSLGNLAGVMHPEGENGLWAPFDLLNCTSSNDKDAIPDDWGVNFEVVMGQTLPGNSLSLSLSLPSLFISGFVLFFSRL
jgi:hypothetical protein